MEEDTPLAGIWVGSLDAELCENMREIGLAQVREESSFYAEQPPCYRLFALISMKDQTRTSFAESRRPSAVGPTSAPAISHLDDSGPMVRNRTIACKVTVATAHRKAANRKLSWLHSVLANRSFLRCVPNGWIL